MEAGFLAPKEVQARTLSRIGGGQDVIAIGPEGSGKTTTYVLGVLSRLKYGVEEAPRSLILVPDREKVEHVIAQFDLLNKNKTIRVRGAFAGPSLESQMDDILQGTDIVVATPDRARAIYLKLGLNLNKIVMFVVDDADQIVKQGLQLPVVELANSIKNCQHLIFSEVLHERLEKMINPFMKDPAVIEVEDMEESEIQTLPQLLYQVPNFRTKINLLQLLLEDDEIFTKVLVFVNTRLTAERIYTSLKPNLKKTAAILKPISFESHGTETVEEFLQQDDRILLIADELQLETEDWPVPFIMHVELPKEKEMYISRIVGSEADADIEKLAITLCTDLELGDVRKIEQAIGKKMEVAELPEGLQIAKETEVLKEKQPSIADESRGAAFHPKKAANAKDYNLSASKKARMNKKKKH
ncbi:DEAD/DEAH box helicase [Pedobacter sp. SYSU D00535]|uniref:DEAD/DEAH box helicase n=1 Tax=Pedobacter sp. SYSU D00535 TaxID=2810308 RepID=UPI001F610301|nr:DEAD/DEAH box helicase [Pedobacter sp. SYSU D00535]